MASTYTVSELFDLAQPNYEMPFTAITGHPYLEFIAMVGIYNGDASGDDLYIKRISVNYLCSQNTTLPTNYSIQRVTSAPTLGTAVTAMKLDSAINSLPAQIELRKYPLFTTGTTMMLLSQSPRQNTARVNQAICVTGYGVRRNQLNAQIRSFFDGSATGYVLNEGQGLLLTPVTTPYSHQLEVNITFATSDGTYMLNESVIPNTKENGLISIWNGSGSGKVITIKEINVYENGEDTPPYFTIEKIDGLYNGTDITPIQNDSLNGALPSQVLVRKDCNVMVAGTKAGAIITTPQLMRTNLSTLNTGESITSLALPTAFANTLNRRKDDGYIHLRNGEGIAVIKKSISAVPSASGIGKYEVFIEFTKVDQGGTSSAAETSYVF